MAKDIQNVLRVRDLNFSYGSEPLIELDEFDLNKGEHVAVMGPSGSGKTTLMHLFAGLIRPTSGSIQLQQQEITQLKEWEMDRLRGKAAGIVFQKFHLMPAINVLENLTLAQKLARVTPDKQLAQQLLDRLGIAHLAQAKPSELSQGQVQGAAIARAVIHNPALVIGDEPTSALDDNNATEAINLLKELSETQGFALLIVTHDQRVRSEMDRVIELGGDA